jgi:hypothetical protein
MFAGYRPHSEFTGINIISIQNRLNRAVAKMPPPPITRESIDASLRSLGLDVEATWRFICAEGIGPGQIRHMSFRGLKVQIDRYMGMTGSYYEKAQPETHP